jgi:cytoskeletal protein RodZ
MFEIGDSLREARIRKGLNLKEAEDATKIRSKYLQALEDDDFEVIPGPTFVKGFLRTYAEFLGLEADLLIDEYRSRFEPNQEVHYQPRKPIRDRDRRPRRQSNLVLVGVIAVALLALLYWAGWGRGDSSTTLPPEAVESDNSTTSLVESVETTATASPDQGTTDTTGEASTTTTAAPGILVVEVTAARGRCWLLFKEQSAEGKVVYSGTLEEGDTMKVESSDSYWANIGSPTSLDLTLNGAVTEVPEPYGNFLVSASGLERLP